VIAWRAWSGRLTPTPERDDVVPGVVMMILWGSRPRNLLLKAGVAVSVVVLLFFLWWTFFLYCLFFCGSGIPLPGEYRESSGIWQTSGVRYLAPGFWLLLSGLLLSVGSDLTVLAHLRRVALQSRRTT
jgi:hypothetical protein